MFHGPSIHVDQSEVLGSSVATVEGTSVNGVVLDDGVVPDDGVVIGDDVVPGDVGVLRALSIIFFTALRLVKNARVPS